MKTGFNERFSGRDVAGHAIADLSLGAQGDHRRLRFVAVSLLDRRLQRFQLRRVHEIRQRVLFRSV